MIDWQPIETAPKDAAIKMLTNGTVVFIGRWFSDPLFEFPSGKPMEGWAQYRCITGRGYNTAAPSETWPFDVRPTHWAPLPELPT